MVTICLFQCFYLRREYVWLVTCLFVSQTALFMHHLSIIKEFQSEIIFADWQISCKFVLLARNCVLTNHAAPGGTGLRVVGVCPAVPRSPHTAPCRAAPLSAGTLCSPKTPTTPVSTEPAREQGLLPRE